MSEMNLTERLEKATGPDREIDLDLMVLGFGGPRETYLSDELGRLEFGHHWKFTRSLDAALALVERVLPGCSWSIANNMGADKHYGAALSTNEGYSATTAGASTAALALCLAVVRAKTAPTPNR